MEKVVLRDVFGSLRISEDVLVKIAAAAVLEVDGVKALAKLPFYFNNGKGLIPKKNSGVSIDGNGELAVINAAVVLEADKSASRVSKLVQQNVKEAVQNMTGVAVSKVNVYVQDISF
ncbi:MAG: Asp23/Gls24 family envelope stress response protein [Oscillospiraceae bacterium]|nr:Asp23/Gls24 family envelope stress response protein [Oscillospiraceae bacterium]